MVFAGPGQPIWVGRDHRTATLEQWKALIARDRGCVGCGAEVSRCEAHHVIAWLACGPTDIDNLVLLCCRCHHDVHDRQMELARDDAGGGGSWPVGTRWSEPVSPCPERARRASVAMPGWQAIRR
ncbi:MAG: HNH endonuclease signature motif containing protein [Acidimicrobiales bacterium]